MAHARKSALLILAAAFLCAAANATDITPPTAALGNAPDVNNANASSYTTIYTFTVVYTDDVAVDVTTLSDSNIQVTGPDGSVQPAILVGSNPGTNAASVTATYQFSPVSGAVTVAADGAYVLALLASQVKDTTGNAALALTLGTVSINLFQFSSFPTATPAVIDAGQTIQFNAIAAANGNVTYTWNFGDGLTGTGASIGHVYVNPGVYTVQFSAADAHGQTLAETLTVVINPAPPQEPQSPNPIESNPQVPVVPGGPPAAPLIANPNNDDDGDGYTNDVEQAFETDPESAASTPFDLPPIPSSQHGRKLTIRALAVFLDFVHPNNDQIYLSGVVPAGNFATNQQIVIVNVGHVIRAFKLSAVGIAQNSLLPSGLAGSNGDTFKLNTGKTNRAFIAQFTAGDYQQLVSADPSPAFDLTNVQGSSHTRQVTVTVYMNGAVYQATSKQAYNAKTGKFGRK